MNEERRAQLVDAITAAFSAAQLDSLVRRTLQTPLEHYAIAQDLPTLVDKLIAELERQERDIMRFLLPIRESTNRPQLKAAINSYFGLTDKEEDPYRALFALERPFVDRDLFRDKLRDLFGSDANRVLVTRGPRYCGRSHSRWLIQHVAQANGAQVVFVDLLEDDVPDIITQLINEMALPPQEFRDRIAQASTLGKGFISALRGHTLRTNEVAHEWCLVFDHVDREEVSEAAREFIHLLITNAANSNLPNIRVIVLGHKASLPPEIAFYVLEEEILPLQPTDVARFLTEVAAKTGKPVSTRHVSEMREKIFDELRVPLDRAGMLEMARRLRIHLATLR
jgi:hypothetical protein